MGDKSLVFAVDLGGTHLRAAVIDRQGNIQHRFRQFTPKVTQPEEMVHALVETARDCKSKTAHLGKVSSVSVAVPGTVNFNEGVVLTAPNLPVLSNFPLRAALQEELQLPVIIENDGNAAALGEMLHGAGKGYSSIVCITLGTGVGGGIILDGRIWRGSDGTAGEIGHIGVAPLAGDKCACGSRGCLEVYASATAIVRLAREALKQRPVTKLNNFDELNSERVYDAGLEGDGIAIGVFRDVGAYLGIGIAAIVNLLNPQMIIIGGGVANGWDLFHTSMHQEVQARAFPLAAERLKITRAQCGDDAGLLGAAMLALKNEGELV